MALRDRAWKPNITNDYVLRLSGSSSCDPKRLLVNHRNKVKQGSAVQHLKYVRIVLGVMAGVLHWKGKKSHNIGLDSKIRSHMIRRTRGTERSVSFKSS